MHPPSRPAGPGRSDGGALDGFFPRIAAQVVAMAAVALGTLWLVDQRGDQNNARIDGLQEEIELLRHERDRMQRLNTELAREVHDAGVSSEIARWQLRWTEERLRRTEAELAMSQGRTASARAALARSGPDAPPVAGPRLELPIRRGEAPERTPPVAPAIIPLDAEAAEVLDARVHRLADGDGLAIGDGADAARPDPAPEGPRGAGIDPSRFDPLIGGLRPAGSQRERDRAFLAWKQVVGDAVAGECRDKLGEAAARRCANDVERDLFPYAEVAVRCLLTDNAAPDYVVADLSDLDRLPTHSKPLRRGAVILCDGALTNL